MEECSACRQAHMRQAVGVPAGWESGIGIMMPETAGVLAESPGNHWTRTSVARANKHPNLGDSTSSESISMILIYSFCSCHGL